MTRPETAGSFGFCAAASNDRTAARCYDHDESSQGAERFNRRGRPFDPGDCPRTGRGPQNGGCPHCRLTTPWHNVRYVQQPPAGYPLQVPSGRQKSATALDRNSKGEQAA